MEFDKIITDLKNKVYHPVYFLTGKEPYYIDVVSDYIEKNILNESEREFNQTVLYGGETNIPAVLATAKRYPMMSPYQVVIVKEAQNMKGFTPPLKDGVRPLWRTIPSPKGKGSEDKQHPLEIYLESPQKSTILVFCYKYKTIDMRTTLAKTLGKKAVVLKSEAIKDYKIPRWIEDFLKEKEYSIEPIASQLLTEFLGNELGKIVNELEKLFLNIPKKSRITTEHIQKYIGISKEYNNFELEAAIGKRDALKANRIINYFASNPNKHPFTRILDSLASYFTKILVFHYLQDKSQNNVAAELKVNPYFVKGYVLAARNYPPAKTLDVISLLREYDMRSKGIDGNNTEPGELLKELVFRIMH